MYAKHSGSGYYGCPTEQGAVFPDIFRKLQTARGFARRSVTDNDIRKYEMFAQKLHRYCYDYHYMTTLSPW